MKSPKRPSNKRRPSSGKPDRSPERGNTRGFRPKAGGVTKRRDSERQENNASSKSEKSLEVKQPVFQRRVLPEGPSPKSITPKMLVLDDWNDYALIDSGFGQKLERYGRYTLVRPEAQALWQPSLPQSVWDKADAIFTGTSGDEDSSGRWRFQNLAAGHELEDIWPLKFGNVSFNARFTSFRHVGLFAEQAAHWQWFHKLISKSDKPTNVLNLFGYTGIASLVAADAGAEVTHVDASKKAIGWARENQSVAGLDEAKIRWICDDAVKFVEREARRGRKYDGIIMDPPKYGRGPKGEVWQFFECLPDMLHACRDILADEPLFFILSSYAIRASYMAGHELCRDAFSGLGGALESGELLIQQEGSERALSTSLFTRWSREEGQ